VHPTFITIPEFYDSNFNLIQEKTYYDLSEYINISNIDESKSDFRLIIDLVPEEYNKSINYSFYRMYSTWIDIKKKKSYESSPEIYSFQKSNFLIDSFQNNITITFNIYYATKFDVIFHKIIVLFFIPFIAFGIISSIVYPKIKNKWIKIIIFLSALGYLVFAFLSERPEGYLFTIFDLLFILFTTITLIFSKSVLQNMRNKKGL